MLSHIDSGWEEQNAAKTQLPGGFELPRGIYTSVEAVIAGLAFSLKRSPRLSASPSLPAFSIAVALVGEIKAGRHQIGSCD